MTFFVVHNRNEAESRAPYGERGFFGEVPMPGKKKPVEKSEKAQPKEVKKEMREHPWAGKNTARKIANDHAKERHEKREKK